MVTSHKFNGVVILIIILSLLFLVFVLGTKQALAQEPIEVGNSTFGGPNIDLGYSVSLTSDGGYIIVGLTSSYGAGSDDVWLIKTDSSGSYLWDRTFGGTASDGGYSGLQTPDGGYIVTGWTDSYGAGSDDVWLIKTDSAGNRLWDRTFGGTDSDRAYSVQLTSDGGYILTGWTYSYGAGNDDVWLIKTDSAGNRLWDKTFGSTDSDRAYSVQLTSDEGYIIAGLTSSYGAGSDDVWLIKTDSAGNRLWDRTFGGPYSDWGYSIQQTSEGGYIIAGLTYSYGVGNDDVWLIKTDSLGNKLWDRTFGGTDYDLAYSVGQTSDGGYVLAGFTSSYGAGYDDIWLIKTDSSGNKLWDRTFGGTNFDWAHSVQQISDGGFIVAGWTDSYGAGHGDVWLIKVYVQSVPDQPSNLLPSDHAMGVNISPTLISSNFSDADIDDVHSASQWQITAISGNYSSPVFDSGVDTTHLVNVSVPLGTLICRNSYYWHVRYQDNRGGWSSYSNQTSFVTGMSSSITAATGTGSISFCTSIGIIENEVAVQESSLPTEGKPSLVFPHGLFSFDITDLVDGETVTVTIEFPSNIPIDTEYWKWDSLLGWHRTDFGDNDGDNIITIQLTDNGNGDSDPTPGRIHDDGGLGDPSVGSSKVPVFPNIYIGIGAALGAGVLAYFVRRSVVRQI